MRIERAGIALWVLPEALAPGGPRPAVGEKVALRLPKGLDNRSPGYYTALGDRGLPPGGTRVRVYWSLRAEGAAAAMEAVTGALNRRSTPFVFKILTDPSAFARCDAGVLYIDRANALGAVRIARAFAAARPDAVRDRVPALTRSVGRGVSMAEDPDDGESFGLNRCRLIADAVVGSWDASERGVDALLAAVEVRFALEGISLDAPHRRRETTARVAA